jgi:multimeric flavodoxin WrbA
MRVILLNGSPRKGGNTDVLCDEFIRGACETGAECEKVYLDDLTILPAPELSDVQRERVDTRAHDDCRLVLDKVIAAEVVVLASPVYWQGVTAQLKCFVDRFSCHYAQPWFNEGMRGKVWAVLTPFGASDRAEADWILKPVRIWVEHFKGEYAGEVAVSVFRKGAVREMPEALRAAYELGKAAVERVSQPGVI